MTWREKEKEDESGREKLPEGENVGHSSPEATRCREPQAEAKISGLSKQRQPRKTAQELAIKWMGKWGKGHERKTSHRPEPKSQGSASMTAKGDYSRACK